MQRYFIRSKQKKGDGEEGENGGCKVWWELVVVLFFVFLFSCFLCRDIFELPDVRYTKENQKKKRRKKGEKGDK